MHKITASGLRWLWVAVLVIVLDRFTKLWMLHHLVPYDPLKILPVLNFTLAYNTGAAFSFLHTASGWQNIFLGCLALIVSLLILLWLKAAPKASRWWNIALCLILGGALGNAWDRALYGFVIDFFDFHLGDWHFAIFNIADSAICIGGIMVAWSWFKYKN